MRYIAAYLLLQLGGKASPSSADIRKVITAGGVDCDQERLDKFLSEIEGKNINDLIVAGSSKLASVPSGGGGGGGGSGGGGGAGSVGAAPAAAAEEKKEEKKEEAKEESDDDMGFGLFD